MTNNNSKYINELQIDCSKCFGLCCTALYFAACEGFPQNKDAGIPCKNLNKDFSCKIHSSLQKKGLKGCTAYDCFGAGQKIAQKTFKNTNWRDLSSEEKKKMFDGYLVMIQLHEMLWYLNYALYMSSSDKKTNDKISKLADEIHNITLNNIDDLLSLNIESLRNNVNTYLKNISEYIRKKFNSSNNNTKPKKDFFGKDLRKKNLKGADLRGACLIAANLTNVDLSGADLISADMRDANICGADLSQTLFLTQIQINGAKGDINTKLPSIINRPPNWK